MRRKDILIISSIVIVILFLTVFRIYCVLNGEKIQFNQKEEITELASKEYYSNGWCAKIVSKIIHDVPVPVGFTYIEGDKKTGLIIKNDNTNEEYMWIPYEEDAGSYMNTELNLKGSAEDSKESILEYNGFFVAIDSQEEKYDKYLRENTNDAFRYHELKNVGYEAYKKAYEEQVGEEFDLNKVEQEEIEELELRNAGKTEIGETHLITIEENALLKKYEETLGKTILVKDFKALTLATNINTENKLTEEEQEETKEDGKDEKEQTGSVKWDKRIATEKDGVPVPQGFVHKEGTTIETGFIIEQEDSENLRFIWIPVEDVNAVKDTFLKYAKEANLDEELVIDAYKKYIDEEGEQYTALVDSIKMYGGFYVSEAELGYDINGDSINVYRTMTQSGYEEFNRVSNGDYYRNLDDGNKAGLYSEERNFQLTYENAKNKCNELYSVSESVVSHLTYGIEYDAVVNYLIKNGLDVGQVFNDSREIGKYKNTLTTTERAANGVWDEKYLNGIYGLAGNLAEITQERCGDKIIVRGGSWNTEGNVQQLANKLAMDTEEIEVDIETIGFRACLYIKTEYEDKSSDLEGEKTKVKEEFENYINNEITNKESKVIKEIKDWTNKRIEKAKSSAALNEIVNDGISKSRQVEIVINYIISYRNDVNYAYTYGETNDICWEIKEKAVEQIRQLNWNDDKTFTDSNGEPVILNDIFLKAKEEIEVERDKFVGQVLEQYIDGYVKGKEVKYQKIVDMVTESAKIELEETEDLDNIMTIVEKWQGIFEIANGFEEFVNEEILNENGGKVIDRIIEWINGKTEEESLQDRVNSGIKIVWEIETAIKEIIKHPDIDNYYGATSDECWKIKEAAINEIRDIVWKKYVERKDEKGNIVENYAVCIDGNGNELRISEIIVKAKKEIETVRKAYRNTIITTYIDDYKPYGGTSCAEIIEKIKENAKEKELNITEDFDNIISTVEKWHTIIEIANGFNEENPDGEYSTEWIETKQAYLESIAELTTIDAAKEKKIEGTKKLKEMVEQKEVVGEDPADNPTDKLAGTDANGIYDNRRINYDSRFAALTQSPEELGLTVKKYYEGARTTTFGPEAFANSGYEGKTCVPGINLEEGRKIAAKPKLRNAKNYSDVKVGDWIYIPEYGYFLVSDIGDGQGRFANVNWFDLFHLEGETRGGFRYQDYSNVKVIDQAVVEQFIANGYVR